MNETATEKEASSEVPMHLMSEELEEAINKFLLKIEELEGMLSMVDE